MTFLLTKPQKLDDSYLSGVTFIKVIKIKPNAESVAAQFEFVPAVTGSLTDGAELVVGNYVPRGPPRALPDVPSAVVNRPLWLGPRQG